MIYSYPSNKAFVVPAGTKLSKKTTETKKNKDLRKAMKSITKQEDGAFTFSVKVIEDK